MHIFFAALFMLSSISKIVDFQDFHLAIKQFGIIINKKVIILCAYLFVISELFISLLFIFFTGHWLTYVSAISIMLTFTIALLRVILDKKKISCYCFGKSKKQTNVHVAVVRNTSIIALLLVTLLFTSPAELNVFENLNIMIAVILFSVITLISKEFLFDQGGSSFESSQ
ncbi:MauE/DoxX family redox-associated membrane protein [Paenibacillus arenosi]